MGKGGLGRTHHLPYPHLPALVWTGLLWTPVAAWWGFWLPEGMHFPDFQASAQCSAPPGRMGVWGATWDTGASHWSEFQDPEAPLLRQSGSSNPALSQIGPGHL